MLKYIIPLLLTLLMVSSVKAQFQDLEGWYSISADIGLGKKWGIDTKQELRFKSNSGKLDVSHTTVSVKFEQKKWLEHNLGTRLTFNQNSKGAWKESIRMNYDLKLKKKYKRYKVTSRTRIQMFSNSENLLEWTSADDAFFREKVSVKYRIKKSKLTPFFSAELFLGDYSNWSDQEIYIEPVGYRILTGVEWDKIKKQKLKLFFGFENELNNEINKRIIILGLNYKFKLRSKY